MEKTTFVTGHHLTSQLTPFFTGKAWTNINYAIGSKPLTLKRLLIGWLTVMVTTGVVRGQATCGCDYTITKAGVYNNATLKVRPGQTVCVQAGRYDFLRFNGFVGTPNQPIRFVNCGGLVSVGVDAYYSGIQFNTSRYFILSGTGDPAITYGFRLDRSNQSASGLSIGGLSSDCEVERVEVAYAGFAGFMIKTDPGCDSATWRDNYTMYNVRLHDNYIHDTGGEGMYIGHSYYTGVTVTCDGVQKTVYPHLIYGLQVYNNRIEHTAAEGLQYGCAPDAQVHHNLLSYTGIAPFAAYQNNGLQIGGGGGGDCFSNQISHVGGIGLIIIGHLGNSRIYDNVIYDASQDGIFCDDRTGSLPNTYMLFANNTISSIGRDGIRLYNQNNSNTLINNAVTQFNKAGNQGGRAFTFMQGTTATLTTNFTATSAATAMYSNESADFRPAVGSPLINTGTDISNWGISTDLAGNSRTGNGGYDRGAYEYTASAPNARLSGLIEEQTADAILIFPSPAHSSITISLPDKQPILQLTIFTQHTSIPVAIPTDSSTDTFQYSVQQLPAGVYTVLARTATGRLYRGRFVKV